MTCNGINFLGKISGNICIENFETVELIIHDKKGKDQNILGKDLKKYVYAIKKIIINKGGVNMLVYYLVVIKKKKKKRKNIITEKENIKLATKNVQVQEKGKMGKMQKNEKKKKIYNNRRKCHTSRKKFYIIYVI
jgi:hypothetical protein